MSPCIGQRGLGGSEGGAWTRPPQPPRYLFLACAIIIHAVLGGHGSGGVQGGSVEGHPLHIGDVAGEVGQAQAVRLVWVPPALEELFEQRGLATLGKDGDLEEEGKSRMWLGSGPPGDRDRQAGVLRGASDSQPTSRVGHPPHPSWNHSPSPTWLQTHLSLLGVVHLGDEVGGRFEGSLPLLGVGLPAYW